MSFTDINFIVRFIPVFLFIYYISYGTWRNGILCIGSILFCAWGDWRNVLLLLAMTVVDYLLLLMLQKKEGTTRKVLLGCLLLLNAGTLLFFKYVWHQLPLGISFYTFMAISAVVDVYMRKTELSDFVTFLTYLTMFPKQIQGPIVQYQELKPQIEERFYTREKLEYGVELFVVGLGFKVLVADTIGKLWNNVMTIGVESISTPMAWLGVLAFSMQLYFDFQGYSLMAIGLGAMLGFDFPKNFDHPYAASSVSEYYRRWHITLGRWFRDYVYIPLGGSRVEKGRLLLNLFAVWLLTGIWHGSTLNFLIWAGVLFFLIVMEKLLYGRFLKEHKMISHLYIWFLIPLTWVVFAITDIRQLGIYFTRLFPFWGAGTNVNAMDFIHYGKNYVVVVLLAFLVSTSKMELFFKKYKNTIWMKMILFVLFWVCMYVVANGANNPFMYSIF